MRIVHFSDWHGDLMTLPDADLYVCTGDMLPNFLEDKKAGPVAAHEVEMQTGYFDEKGHGYMRTFLGHNKAPVICCRGNHEFIDLAPAFAGGPVFEISLDPTRTTIVQTANGPLKLGGMRGVMRYHGSWSDEMSDADLADLVARLPNDLDLLVTHSPPHGILDEVNGSFIGSTALRSYVARHDPSLKPLKAHFFGHAHFGREHPMKGISRQFGDTIFSNAARCYQIIDL